MTLTGIDDTIKNSDPDSFNADDEWACSDIGLATVDLLKQKAITGAYNDRDY